MFKRFTCEDGISGQNLVKSSVQRGIRGAAARAQRLPRCGGGGEPRARRRLPLLCSPQAGYRNNFRCWRKAARWRCCCQRRTRWLWGSGESPADAVAASDELAPTRSAGLVPLRALRAPPPPSHPARPRRRRPVQRLTCGGGARRLRSQNHVNVVIMNGEVLFFNLRDGPYFPTLRVLHQCAPRRRFRCRGAAPLQRSRGCVGRGARDGGRLRHRGCQIRS